MPSITEHGFPNAFGRPPEANPLQGFFRIPGVHVPLPTNGAFLPPGSLELTMTGEVPVYPMRGGDELLLKSPDALMSGYALEKLLESCVPGLRTPRLVSQPDLDVLLIAVRAATYGDVMPLSAPCPKCESANEFDCNLPALLATAQKVSAENPVRLSDQVVAFVRPYNLHNATIIALASFEEARRLQALDMAETKSDGATRAREVNVSLERINRLNLEMTADCVIRVTIPDNDVRDPTHIRDFCTNIPKPWVNKIEKKVGAINKMGINREIQVKCSSCEHEWTTEVELDPGNFFDNASSE